MAINKDQREGLAKIADNLATTCIVSMIVGGIVDEKLGWRGTMLLLVLFVVLVFVGLRLRREGNGNGN